MGWTRLPTPSPRKDHPVSTPDHGLPGNPHLDLWEYQSNTDPANTEAIRALTYEVRTLGLVQLLGQLKDAPGPPGPLALQLAKDVQDRYSLLSQAPAQAPDPNDRLADIIELHHRSSGDVGYCMEDKQEWPCRTVQAVRGDS